MEDDARRTKRQRVDGDDHSSDVKVLCHCLALCVQSERRC